MPRLAELLLGNRFKWLGLSVQEKKPKIGFQYVTMVAILDVWSERFLLFLISKSSWILDQIIMSPPDRGEDIVFASVVCLSICPSRSHVSSITWKPIKIFSWNLLEI